MTREEQINYLTKNGYMLLNGDKDGEECFAFISLVRNAIAQKQQVFCKIISVDVTHEEMRCGKIISPIEVGMFFIVDEEGVSNCFCGPLHFTPMFCDKDVNVIVTIYDDMYRKDMCAMGLCKDEEDEEDEVDGRVA